MQELSDAEKARQLLDCAQLLMRSINEYCDNPGCNIPSRQTALRKLRWAAEHSQQKIEGMNNASNESQGT
jgi:hypothetical protein